MAAIQLLCGADDERNSPEGAVRPTVTLGGSDAAMVIAALCLHRAKPNI